MIQPEPMFSIPIRIVRDPSVTGRDFKVLAVMYSHWDAESGTFDVSNSTLARESGYPERAVDLAMSALERAGYLSPKVPPGSLLMEDDDGETMLVTVTAQGWAALGMEPPTQ